MRVRLLSSRAGYGPYGGVFSQKVGDEIEVDAAEARRMIAGRLAESVETTMNEKRGRGRPQGRAMREVPQ